MRVIYLGDLTDSVLRASSTPLGKEEGVKYYEVKFQPRHWTKRRKEDLSKNTMALSIKPEKIVIVRHIKHLAGGGKQFVER